MALPWVFTPPQRPLQGFAVSPGDVVSRLAAMFSLFRRAGDFARRTSANSKNMFWWSFF